MGMLSSVSGATKCNPDPQPFQAIWRGKAKCPIVVPENVWSAGTASEKRRADGQVCANVFVNKGEDLVKDKDILPAAWSNARSQSLETRVRADPFVESFWVERSTPTINSVTTATMIAYSDTQSLLDAGVPTQPVGLACADQNIFQAILDERTCGYGVYVRSIQYIRIASLRAVVALATVKCF
jgi:hypothetical protein